MLATIRAEVGVGLVSRLVGAALARWLDIGHFASAELLEVAAGSVRVRLIPPGAGYRLVSLMGDAGEVDRLGVLPPAGWVRVDEAVEGGVEARFLPPEPIRAPATGVDLEVRFEHAEEFPARLRFAFEARRAVGGGMSFRSFPVGDLLGVEIEAFNRSMELSREAGRRGVTPREVPGFEEVNALEERARATREARGAEAREPRSRPGYSPTGSDGDPPDSTEGSA